MMRLFDGSLWLGLVVICLAGVTSLSVQRKSGESEESSILFLFRAQPIGSEPSEQFDIGCRKTLPLPDPVPVNIYFHRWEDGGGAWECKVYRGLLQSAQKPGLDARKVRIQANDAHLKLLASGDDDFPVIILNKVRAHRSIQISETVRILHESDEDEWILDPPKKKAEKKFVFEGYGESADDTTTVECSYYGPLHFVMKSVFWFAEDEDQKWHCLVYPSLQSPLQITRGRASYMRIWVVVEDHHRLATARLAGSGSNTIVFEHKGRKLTIPTLQENVTLAGILLRKIAIRPYRSRRYK